MRIAINASCAVAGGAVTHLRHVMPEMMKIRDVDELIMIGDPAMRERIDPLGALHWLETPSIRPGMIGRVLFESIDLPKILGEIGADVLFHPANFAAFRSPVPQVILLHNLAPFMPDVIEGESAYQRIRLTLLRSLTLKSLSVAERTIFISEFGRSLVVREGEVDEDRMPIVPFGADHGADRTDESAIERFGVVSGRFILTVSHIYRYKKLEKLVDAYVNLGRFVEDMPLLIVGEPFDQEYASRLADLGRAASGRVVFTGGLPQRDLAALMGSCRIFVFTSEAENLPVTLLEAMSSGCAIITNRTCSMPEVCADAVCYAHPATSERYRQEILALLEDESRTVELRRAARARARNFRWDETARSTLDLLRKAARSSGNPMR